jgi:hypothetical protein
MPGVRRGAGQPVIQAVGRLLESHAGRAPSIKRRSLPPVPLGDRRLDGSPIRRPEKS